MIWRGQPWRSAGFDVMYNWVGFTVNRIRAISIIQSFIHIFSTVCFLVRYLFWLLLSLGKTITFSPSLCRHFSVYQWKLKHAIMKFFTWFWIWLISNIEQFCWTKNNYAFFSLFLTFKRTLWMIYSSRNRIYFTH